MTQIERVVKLLEALVDEHETDPTFDELWDIGYYEGLKKALDQALMVMDGVK